MITKMKTEIGKIETKDGFIIIASHQCHHSERYIVLGVKPNQAEYVTWLCNADGYCSRGHNFEGSNAFLRAVDDFKKRN